MNGNILIGVDDMLRLNVYGLDSREVHELISELLNYFEKKYGKDRQVVLFGKNVYSE